MCYENLPNVHVPIDGVYGKYIYDSSCCCHIFSVFNHHILLPNLFLSRGERRRHRSLRNGNEGNCGEWQYTVSGTR